MLPRVLMGISGGLITLAGLLIVYIVLARRIATLPEPPPWLNIAGSIAIVVAIVLGGIRWMVLSLFHKHEPEREITKPPADSPNLERLRSLVDRLLEPEIYTQIVERLPDALVVVNQKTEIVIFNEQATYLWGYHATEVIGRKLNVLVPEDRREIHDQHVHGFFEAPRRRAMGTDTNLELVARHKTGRIFSVTVMIGPIISPSGIYALGVVRPKDHLSGVEVDAGGS